MKWENGEWRNVERIGEGWRWEVREKRV